MNGNMLAARAYPGEESFRVEEIDRPEIGHGEVLVKVGAAGMSPGALNLWQWGMMKLLPATLSPEMAGTVEEVGEGVIDFQTGDRVRVHANLTCRRCEFCLSDRELLCRQCSLIGFMVFGPDAMPLYERYHDGGLAEYVRVPAWLLDPLPEEIPFDVGAKIHHLAVASRSIKLADLTPGSTVVVTAATGAMGAATVKLAGLFGVARVVAVGRARERVAGVEALAPDLVETLTTEDLPENWAEDGLLTKAIRDLVPEGPDAVIDYLPAGPGTWQSVSSMRPGGSAVIVGGNQAPPTLPALAIMVNSWSVVGNRSCTRSDALELINLLRARRLKVDDLITHRFPLHDANTAMDVVRDRTEPTWMVVVKP